MTSATIYSLHRKKIDDNDSSLYGSVRFANRYPDRIDNKYLRSMVIDYIRKRENWHCLALKHATNCKNIKDYCDKIEKGDLQNDELEFRALAMLCCLLIRVFSITKTLEGNININVLNYGEHIESFTECIYILYDEENKHYDPLYAINKQKPDENITIFKRDDETIVQLVYIFLQEEFHYDANIQSDCNNLVVESDLPTEPNVLNETERIFNLATPSSSINLSNKRKTLNYDSLKWTQTIEQVTSSLSRSNSTYVSNKRIKSSKFDSSKNLSSNKNNSELLTIEQYLQMDINFNQFDSSNEKQKIENSQISLNNKFEIEKMKFEIEPTLKFRGRTLTDFKPKKAQKRNGEPSEPRPPRYFRDRNHRGYLNLLIPEAYLLPDIIQYYFEICIVTREINGYTYIHPYFKFQIHSTDPQSPNLNPKYIYFDSTIEFKTYSETLRQLKLQLVVVMHTNKELMQTKQPLKIFSSTQINNHGNAITTKFNDHKKFKEAYYLHDFRIAVTLWSKKSGEKVFHRHDDKQCISQISTQDKNTKIRQKKKTYCSHL